MIPVVVFHGVSSDAARDQHLPSVTNFQLLWKLIQASIHVGLLVVLRLSCLTPPTSRFSSSMNLGQAQPQTTDALSQPTFLSKRRVLEVVRLNPQDSRRCGRGSFPASGVVPVNFFPLALLLRQPSLEVGVDPLGKRHELVVLVHGEAHEGDEVGEDALAARAFDLGLLQRGVGLPELRFVPEVAAAFRWRWPDL